MSAHANRQASVEELRDARRMAHRMILTKPDAPGRLLLAIWCLDIGAELQRRGELAPDCPCCRADVSAAGGKGARLSTMSEGALPAQLVEATP